MKQKYQQKSYSFKDAKQLLRKDPRPYAHVRIDHYYLVIGISGQVADLEENQDDEESSFFTLE